MESKDELDTRNADVEFLKSFHKKVKKKNDELYKKPDVKPTEVFEGYKEKKVKSSKKKDKKK
jgi:malate synthase